MISSKDVQYRQPVVLTAQEGYKINIANGVMVIRDDSKNILTKIGKHQSLAIIIVGNFNLTLSVIDFCNKNNTHLVICKNNFRPVMFYSHVAEANYICREKQHCIDYSEKLAIATAILISKITSSMNVIKAKRQKNEEDKKFINQAQTVLKDLDYKQALFFIFGDAKREDGDLEKLMGVEGNIAKAYFKCLFREIGWQGRVPRVKADYINSTLDIGYTILFNYIEINLRFFGFDIYIGNLHQNFFKRKSLVCDLIEPFRFVIDKQVLKSIQLQQFKQEHFEHKNGQFLLKKEFNAHYQRVFLEAIIEYKVNIFKNIQLYYRYFMKGGYAKDLNIIVEKDKDEDDDFSEL